MTDLLVTDLACFQSGYHSARGRLLQTVAQIPDNLVRKHQAFCHPLPGPDKNPLYLDWLQLGQSETPKKVLVLISGTHGVEGFAGAAIICNWLPKLVDQLQQDAELGVLILHALNPWGFAWLRRYDHEGIDLNRNFIDFDAPRPNNVDYDSFHEDLFGETTKPVDSILSHWQTQLGKPGFESAITQGQYKHDDGLFFGGYGASWSRKILEDVSKTPFLQQARRVAIIDLHTGLGPFGHGEVINDHTPNTVGFNLACDWYGANAQSALLGESCSSPKTGLLDYFWHQLIGNRGCFVTLEFGTYPLEKLLTLSCEEQRYHRGFKKNVGMRALNHPSVVALRDFFYPQDNSWRELVLFRAGQIITLALQGMRT